MSRKDLLKGLTVNELRKYASSIGVKNSHSFKKAELVEAILEAEKAIDANKKCVANKTNDTTNVGINMGQKMQYIESANIGTLVAFRLPNGKVKSAMIVKKSTQNRKFMVETDYGVQHIIHYEDVVWVRSGKRWPKGVYKLLKGLVENGATEF